MASTGVHMSGLLFARRTVEDMPLILVQDGKRKGK